MTDHEVSRTLVKSLPELWAECSQAESLARHLDPFGEIKITRVEPETAVAWEGEHASGTVQLEPSNWGTRVTLTAQHAAPEPAPPPEPVSPPPPPPPPEPAAVRPPQPGPPEVAATEAPAPPRRGGMFARLRALFALPEPDPPPARQPVAASPPVKSATAEAVPRAREPAASEPAAEALGTEGPPAEDAGPEDAGPEDAAPEDAAPEDAAPEDAEHADAEHDLLDPETALTAALDSLGQAHHRPFSRG